MVRLALEQLSKHPRRRTFQKIFEKSFLLEEEVIVASNEFEFPNFEFCDEFTLEQPSKCPGRRISLK